MNTSFNILSIYFPESPSFIKTPGPVEGVKGRDASLHCEVYGSPPFQVNWYKEKRPLKDSRKYKMVSEGRSATFHVLKLEQGDAGLYECKVSNNVGTGSCRTFISLKGWYRISKLILGLIVSPHLWSFRHCSERPTFVKELVDQSVSLGQQLTLTATVLGSEPLTVTWVQDKDHVLRDSDNRKITVEDNVVTLIVLKVNSSTSGKYTCQLRNDSGLVESVSQVTVLGL